MLDAAIYARISSDDVLPPDPAGVTDRGSRLTGLGVTRQLEDCRRAAAARGWNVVSEFIDNDVSAYSGKVRPGYAQLLAGLRSGHVRAVVAWNGDRLHRSPRELEDFIDVVEGHKVPVAVVMQGDLDLTTSDGRAMARVVGTFSRLESERKSERLRRKHEELAREGALAGGGDRPFGYGDDRVSIRGDEATLIREAMAGILAGDSIRGICRDWNARGVVTTTGGPWQQGPLRRLLVSARNAGWREHYIREKVDGKTRRVLHCDAPARWPGIVDRTMLDRVRLVLLDAGRRKTRPEPRRYLLTGMLTCGVCGRSLRARPRADGTRRYICAKVPGSEGCGLVIVSDPLEDLLVEAALERLDSPAFNAAVAHAEDAPGPSRAEQLAADERGLAQLSRDHYVDRLIGRDEYLAARQPLEARIAATKAQILEQRGQTSLDGVAGVARQRWGELSFDRKRSVLAALMSTITINAGRRGYNRFDPTRVDVEWTA